MKDTTRTRQHARDEVSPLQSDSLDLVTKRLFTVFQAHLSLAEVKRTVRQCTRDLDIVPKISLPEMVERLARQRLLDLDANYMKLIG